MSVACTSVQLCEQVLQATACLHALGDGACDIQELTVQQYLAYDVNDMQTVMSQCMQCSLYVYGLYVLLLF
jgi:hypothetical protein